MTSISGSFQCPGPANRECPTCWKPIASMLSQLSLMSPVVRQELPAISGSAPHSQTLPQPYWHRLYRMSRGTWASALRATRYGRSSTGSWRLVSPGASTSE